MKLTINGVKYSWTGITSSINGLIEARFFCAHGIPKSIIRSAAGSDFGDTVDIEFWDETGIQRFNAYVRITGNRQFKIERRLC